MKTRTQQMGFVVVAGLGVALGVLGGLGCAQAKGDAALQSAPPPEGSQQTQRTPPPPRAGKITAPVVLTFTASPDAAKAGAGPVVLTLTVRALTDIPSGLARVVLPPQVKLLRGSREVPFGALAKDAEQTFSLTVEALPAGPLQIFAGVDCHITSGIQLHKEAQPIVLGPSPASPN